MCSACAPPSPSMLQRLATLEISFVSALVGVGCAPLLHLFSSCLLAATVAAVPASHDNERVGLARRRHLDHGVDRALSRSRLDAVSLCLGRLLPDRVLVRRAIGGA